MLNTVLRSNVFLINILGFSVDGYLKLQKQCVLITNCDKTISYRFNKQKFKSFKFSINPHMQNGNNKH